MELPTEDAYWAGELGFHTVLVTGGKDAVDTWLNREQGLVWIYKKTNTGESVEGWHIAIYSDAECTQEVGTVITNADGKAGHYLSPGIYYAKETGDELGRFEDEYWMVDETVQKIEILPHKDTEITFTNVQYGKLKIQKTVEGDGSLAGWVFQVTDAHGNAIDGSPFTFAEQPPFVTDSECWTGCHVSPPSLHSSRNVAPARELPVVSTVLFFGCLGWLRLSAAFVCFLFYPEKGIEKAGSKPLPAKVIWTDTDCRHLPILKSYST